MIFQISDGSLTNYVQPNFEITGQLLVSNDTVYLVRGGYNVTGFRWEQNHFAKLDADRLAELRSLMKPGGELLPNGWRKLDWQDLGMVDENYDKKFDLAGFFESIALHLKQGATLYKPSGYVESNPTIQIKLLLPEREEQLMELSQNYYRIPAAEFKTFKRQDDLK